MAYTTSILTGHYLTTDGGNAEGVVEVIPNSRQIVDPDGEVILSGRVKVALVDGAFSVTLPATDDATLEPAVDRQYTVVAKLKHAHLAAVTGIELPAGLTVDVASVAVQPAVDATATNAATTAQLAALETVVAGKADESDLNLKADASDLSAVDDRVTTVEGQVAGKASTATVTALGGRVDDVDAGLADKAELSGTNYNVTAYTPTVTVDSRDPVWLCRDGQTIIWTGSTAVQYSTDAVSPKVTNANPLPFNTRAARECADGELLVSTMHSGDFTTRGGLYRSVGWPANKSAATWVKVLDLVTENAYVTNHWSIDVRDGKVIVGEYGPHGGTAATEARRVWYSTDDGHTFTQILDIGFATNRHVHGVAIDEYANLLWVVNGDLEGNCAIRYAPQADPTNWTILDNSYVHQAVGIVPMRDCVLFTSDTSPNGVMRVRRLPDGTFGPIEHPHVLDAARHYSPTTFGRLAFRASEDDPVYMSFAASATNPLEGVVVATMDGENFYEVFRDSISQIAADGGVATAIGPTASGKLVTSLYKTARGLQYTGFGVAPSWTPQAAPVRLTVADRHVGPESVGLAGTTWPKVGESLTPAVKTADTARTTNSRTSDPHLRLIGAGPNSMWAIEGWLIATTASDAADIALSLTTDSFVPADLTGWWQAGLGLTSNTSWVQSPLFTAIAFKSAASYGLDDAAQGGFPIRGFVEIGANQGPIALHWAQATLDAGAVTLKKGSWLKATRLA